LSGTPLSDAASPVLGFYGKLPSHGDFVSRHLPGHFIDAWDRWLQQVLASSRTQLAEQWLDYYTSMPVWRFGLASGIIGRECWAGVLMPSVDRVGRYFPLTLAAPLPEDSDISYFVADQESWYALLTRLALFCLEEDFQYQRFEEALTEPQISHVRRYETRLDSSKELPLDNIGLQLEFRLENTKSDLGPFVRQVMAWGNSYSVWMTDGSEHINPCIVACKNLPHHQHFISFLNGRWDRSVWHDLGTVAS
jgi:type VI secretion system protein ImpM